MKGEEMLAMALSGQAGDWETLHEICLDRVNAEELARSLEKNATRKNEAAAAWVDLLAELHPGLKVTLPSSPPG